LSPALGAVSTPEELQRFLDGPPFQQHLGLRAEAVDREAGSLTIRMPFRRELQRHPQRPEIHGGAIASLIDVAGAYTLAIQVGHGTPTVDLRVDYLRLAVETDLWARSRTLRRGRSLGRIDVEVRDAAGELVAVGRGTWSTATRPDPGAR